MADDDTGISRCGISGLFDGRGNPAALASGETTSLDGAPPRARERWCLVRVTPKPSAWWSSPYPPPCVACCCVCAGWLQAFDKGGRRRHRYFVLTPTYLAYFNSEDHANISEEGFLRGDAAHDE